MNTIRYLSINGGYVRRSGTPSSPHLAVAESSSLGKRVYPLLVGLSDYLLSGHIVQNEGFVLAHILYVRKCLPLLLLLYHLLSFCEGILSKEATEIINVQYQNPLYGRSTKLTVDGTGVFR